MKKVLMLVFCLGAMLAKAQPDDKVIYYEDSKVKKSRVSLAINLNPNWTDRRLIGEETPKGGFLELRNEDADGSFQFNYGLDLFFRLGSALRIGAGFGVANADFAVQNARYYSPALTDTTLVDVNTEVMMYTIPIKLNFNTSLTDAFDLEVIPQVQMNLINFYENTYTPVNGGDKLTDDFSSRTRSVTYSVGIALGGTFKLTDNWGLFVRGDIRYMVNPLIDEVNYPREGLFNIGLNTGLKYSF